MIVFTLALPANSADWNQYRENEARVKAIAANPEGIGDKELQFLMSHLYYPDSITAITKAQTPEARAALWQMALGGGNGSQTAAYALIKRMTNKLERLKLLDSKSPEVQALALRGMAGCALDRRAWEVVKSFLLSDSLELRRRAAYVTSNDSGDEVGAREKAEALVQALSGLESLPGADKRVWFPVASPHADLPCGAAEYAWARLTSALMSPRLAVSVAALRELTPGEDGMIRDCLIIARASRGDESAKLDLRRIVREQTASVVRFTALGAFALAGALDDLAVLEEVAQKDPALIKNWMPPTSVSPEDGIPRDYYPLRERAREVIRTIEQPAASPSSPKPPPTR
jgi:hypothetical protein